MAMNAIDKDLASAYERHGGALKAWKHLGKKTANSVKDAAKKGAGALGAYFSEKMKKGPSKELKQMSINLADNKPRKDGPSPALKEMSIRLAKQHAAKKK